CRSVAHYSCPVRSFSFASSAPLLVLHSFPTRRSSDLFLRSGRSPCSGRQPPAGLLLLPDGFSEESRAFLHWNLPPEIGEADPMRSEEHTSELQSRFDLVCRLLLEKKKKTYIITGSDGQ